MPRGTWLREGQHWDRTVLSFLLLLRDQFLEPREPWSLLSTEFYLVPLLYKCISTGGEEAGLSRSPHEHPICASILGLCLSGAVVLGGGATVYGIERECRWGSGAWGHRSERNIASPSPGILFSLMKRVASECQPSLPVSSQLHHGIKLLIPFIPFWE